MRSIRTRRPHRIGCLFPDPPPLSHEYVVDGPLFFRRLLGRMQEMQEEKRALRAEVAAEQAETEQLRLLVRVVVDHAIWVVLVSTSTLDRDTAAYYWLAG